MGRDCRTLTLPVILVWLFILQDHTAARKEPITKPGSVQELLEYDPEDPVTVSPERLIEITSALLHDRISSTQTIVHLRIIRAYAYWHLGMPAIAVKECAYILKTDPKNATARALQVVLTTDLTNVDAGVKQLQDILKETNTSTCAHSCIAGLLLMQGRHEKAIEHCTLALLQDIGCVRALYYRAVGYAAEKRWNEALLDLDRYLTLRPFGITAMSLEDVYLLRAFIYLQVGEPLRAVPSILLAKRLNGRCERAHLLLLDVYLQTERYNLCCLVAKELVDLAPNSYGHWDKYLVSLMLASRKTEALQVGKDTVSRFPDNPPAWVRLGDANYVCERYEEALTAYKHAYALEPRFKPALHAMIYLLSTSPDASIRNGTRATELTKELLKTKSAKPAGDKLFVALAAAENRRYDEATRILAEVLPGLPEDDPRKDECKLMLQLFKMEKPYRSTFDPKLFRSRLIPYISLDPG